VRRPGAAIRRVAKVDRAVMRRVGARALCLLTPWSIGRSMPPSIKSEDDHRMTLHRSNPRARPRWLGLLTLVASMTLVASGQALASGATSIPANYTGGTQIDVHGANDVPGQVDMTQMGRDTSSSSVYRIFWSWDSISAWTGSGQTGDACALFNNDTDNAFIDFVVCARVSNPNADPTDVRIVEAAAGKPVYLFTCSDKKNDRCTNPTPVTYDAGQVSAGQLGTLNAGNLITETDPFGSDVPKGPGESYPEDSTIDVRIPASIVPAGSSLVNVCSYPSAGNGGNNNPFDCIVTPGVQYGTLVVNKTVTNDNGGSAVVTSFSFKVNGGTATSFTAVGSSTTSGSNTMTVPVGTYSVVEDGLPISGYTTTYTNNKNANTNCTSLAVTVGATTSCTITNNDDITTPTIATTMTWKLDDAMTLTGHLAGGAAQTATFTLYRDQAGVTPCDASTQVATETVSVDDSAGTAQTATGYSTSTTGTYRWVVSYSGNSLNGPTSSSCTSEVTTLP